MNSNLLPILLISLVGCASSNNGPTEFDKRADYGSISTANIAAKTKISNRKTQRVERVCVGSKFLPNGDRFIGGWMEMVVDNSEWIFNDPTLKKMTE